MENIREKIITKRKKHVGKHVLFVVLLLLGIINLYPLFYALLGSFATQEELMGALFLPFPKDFIAGFSNYAYLFTSKRLINAILLTFGKIAFLFVVQVFISVLAGFVFSKIEFWGKNVFFMILMSSMMIPGVALLVPNFIWMARFPLVGGNDIFGQGGMGFINNPMFVFLMGWINVYNIFLCRQAFTSLGNEMSESANVDGANFFQVVFRIYTPLVAPILAIIFLNLFIGNWNDYMTNLIFMPDNGYWHTAGNVFVVVMDLFTDEQRIGGPIVPIAFATSLVSMIPPIIIYILVQKKFTEGLTMGSVKG